MQQRNCALRKPLKRQSWLCVRSMPLIVLVWLKTVWRKPMRNWLIGWRAMPGKPLRNRSPLSWVVWGRYSVAFLLSSKRNSRRKQPPSMPAIQRRFLRQKVTTTRWRSLKRRSKPPLPKRRTRRTKSCLPCRLFKQWRRLPKTRSLLMVRQRLFLWSVISWHLLQRLWLLLRAWYRLPRSKNNNRQVRHKDMRKVVLLRKAE